MNGDGMMPWISGPHIARQFSEAVLLRCGILFLGFGKVVRHGSLSGKTPDNRICAPAGDEVTPMLLDLGHPHARNEVAPKANDTGGEAPISEVLHTHVGHIE